MDEHQRILTVYQVYQSQAKTKFFGYENLAHVCRIRPATAKLCVC
jgi:hypothetical protein